MIMPALARLCLIMVVLSWSWHDHGKIMVSLQWLRSLGMSSFLLCWQVSVITIVSPVGITVWICFFPMSSMYRFSVLLLWRTWSCKFNIGDAILARNFLTTKSFLKHVTATMAIQVKSYVDFSVFYNRVDRSHAAQKNENETDFWTLLSSHSKIDDLISILGISLAIS